MDPKIAYCLVNNLMCGRVVMVGATRARCDARGILRQLGSATIEYDEDRRTSPHSAAHRLCITQMVGWRVWVT